MARKKITYTGLMAMAAEYGVENNALFQAAAQQYELQMEVISAIRAALDSEDALVVTKEYVKGRENLYTNPMVSQLPKHTDAANKTLSTMLDIIAKLGRPAEQKSRLSEMLADD